MTTTKIKWNKEDAGWYVSSCGTYRIEKNEYSGMWNLYVSGEWSTEEWTMRVCKEIAQEKLEEDE